MMRLRELYKYIIMDTCDDLYSYTYIYACCMHIYMSYKIIHNDRYIELFSYMFRIYYIYMIIYAHLYAHAWMYIQHIRDGKGARERERESVWITYVRINIMMANDAQPLALLAD